MSGAAIIVCEGLGKRFGDSWALRGLDLELRRGEVLGVVGPGGHGKSVLLKCLAGLLRPDEGRVVVDGQDLARLGSRALARVRERFGYLFQNYALFDFMSVRDNVAFPLEQQRRLSPEAIERAVRARLGELGLAHALALQPSELSGGMKKRVGLARATIAEPEIGLYDDPSAGLDPVTSSKIFRLIARMHAKRGDAATVIVSHDLDRMRALCDRYVMLVEGRVAFEGREAEASEASALVSAFFGGGAVSKRRAPGGRL